MKESNYSQTRRISFVFRILAIARYDDDGGVAPLNDEARNENNICMFWQTEVLDLADVSLTLFRRLDDDDSRQVRWLCRRFIDFPSSRTNTRASTLPAPSQFIIPLKSRRVFLSRVVLPGTSSPLVDDCICTFSQVQPSRMFEILVVERDRARRNIR